jgi:hypothetical protein
LTLFERKYLANKAKRMSLFTLDYFFQNPLSQTYRVVLKKI